MCVCVCVVCHPVNPAGAPRVPLAKVAPLVAVVVKVAATQALRQATPTFIIQGALKCTLPCLFLFAPEGPEGPYSTWGPWEQ